jgi:hypothetical protein
MESTSRGGRTSAETFGAGETPVGQPVGIAEVVRNPVRDPESLESTALLVASALFIVVSVTAAILFWGRYSPISGPGSVGQFVGLAGGITAAAVFLLARGLVSLESSRQGPGHVPAGPIVPQERLRWFDVAALALAHAMTALLIWIGVADLVSKSFTGAVVYTLSAAVLSGAAIAITGYVVFLSAVNITPILLAVVLAAFVIVGTFASMLSASDPYWWQENLSTLGISDDFSARSFNVTLMIAGVVVTTIAHYATSGLPASTPQQIKGRNFVRYCLIIIGILLSCVGLLPLDEFFAAHGATASGMLVTYVTMVIGLRWALPATPRVFILLGYVYVGVIALLAVFYLTGYYNLTAAELVAFMLVFSWVIVFLRNSQPGAGQVMRIDPGDSPVEQPVAGIR